MTRLGEIQVGRRARAPSGPLGPTRWMAAQDRIRLTGQLRKGLRQRGPFYVRDSELQGTVRQSSNRSAMAR